MVGVTPSFEPRRGRGPVGTGVHLLRCTLGPAGTTVADVWLSVLFVPLVPLGRWTLEREGTPGSAWRVTRVGSPHLGRSVAWVAGGLLAALASLLPAWLAVTVFMGSKAAELAGLFSSAGAIIGALGWLDQTRDRVPFGAATRIVAARPSSPGDGP
jgi:hypothetical protein